MGSMQTPQKPKGGPNRTCHCLVLTKERQKRLKGEVHDPPARLLSRLQHDLLLTHLTQIKPWQWRKKNPAHLVHFGATCAHSCDLLSR